MATVFPIKVHCAGDPAGIRNPRHVPARLCRPRIADRQARWLAALEIANIKYHPNGFVGGLRLDNHLVKQSRRVVQRHLRVRITVFRAVGEDMPLARVQVDGTGNVGVAVGFYSDHISIVRGD